MTYFLNTTGSISGSVVLCRVFYVCFLNPWVSVREMVFPVCNGVLQRMQLPRTWEGNVALFTKKSRDTKICWRGQNIQSHNLLDVLFE